MHCPPRFPRLSSGTASQRLYPASLRSARRRATGRAQINSWWAIRPRSGHEAARPRARVGPPAAPPARRACRDFADRAVADLSPRSTAPSTRLRIPGPRPPSDRRPRRGGPSRVPKRRHPWPNAPPTTDLFPFAGQDSGFSPFLARRSAGRRAVNATLTAVARTVRVKDGPRGRRERPATRGARVRAASSPRPAASSRGAASPSPPSVAGLACVFFAA
jgi:hypothetical protein